MTLSEKQSLFELVIKTLEENLKVLVESAFEAKEASTNEESKAENKYDTRGLEASYLASGQAKRAQKLQEQIYLLNKVELKEYGEEVPVGISSVIRVVVDGEKEMDLFLIPAGGVEVDFKSKRYKTITIESPLGSQLMGQTVGHDFLLNNKEYEICEVY